jgi:hypothetical protein
MAYIVSIEWGKSEWLIRGKQEEKNHGIIVGCFCLQS